MAKKDRIESALHFERGLLALESYVNEPGNIIIPVKAISADGFMLGVWCSYQRAMKAKNALSQERMARLERVIGWTWRLFDKQWSVAFKQLQAYANAYGHASVPQKYSTVDGFNLGAWIRKQREMKSKGALSQERIGRLESVPGWTWTRLNARWLEAFVRLNAHINAYGHANIPYKHITADGFSLGKWVSAQRLAKARNSLSRARIAHLNADIRWYWDVSDRHWKKYFMRLSAYANELCDSDMSENFITADRLSLGLWCRGQRDAKLAGRLGQEYIDRLNSLSWWYWDVGDRGMSSADKHWKKAFAQLQAYVNEHGSADMPKNFVTADKFSMDLWCRAQRDAKLAGKLSQEKIDQLDAISGWSWGDYAAK